MENFQHLARVKCVTAGKVRLSSENTEVSTKAHLDLHLGVFLHS